MINEQYNEQYIKDYFNKYECFHFSNKKKRIKSDTGKMYTKKLSNYKFEEYIKDIIKNSQKWRKYQCDDFDITEDDIWDMIKPLFYNHIKMAQNILTKTTYSEKIYISDLIKSIESFQKRGTNFFEISGERNKYKEIIRKRLKSETIEELENSDAAYFMWKNGCPNTNYLALITFLMGMHKHMKYAQGINQLRLLLNIEPNIDNEYEDGFEFDYSDFDIDIGGSVKYTVEAYNELRDLYDAILTKDKYIVFDDDDRILEKQLIDWFFGCEIMGYVFKETANKEYPDKCDFLYRVVQKTGCISLLGITSCTKKLIDKRIDFEIKKINKEQETKQRPNYDYSEDYIEAEFVNDILSIFYDIMKYFVEYIYFLNTNEERVEYVKNIHFAPVAMSKNTNNLDYFFDEAIINELVYSDDDTISDYNKELTEDALNQLYNCYFESFLYVNYKKYFFFQKKISILNLGECMTPNE